MHHCRHAGTGFLGLYSEETMRSADSMYRMGFWLRKKVKLGERSLKDRCTPDSVGPGLGSPAIGSDERKLSALSSVKGSGLGRVMGWSLQRTPDKNSGIKLGSGKLMLLKGKNGPE